MPTRLYVMPISNAAAAGAAMVGYKRVPHRLVRLMPGLHPVLLRFAGFDGFTVPALELDGRKVQGSRQIARALDAVSAERPLFPLDPERRARVEEAERWGEQVLQPVPRRLFRHAAHKRGRAALDGHRDHAHAGAADPLHAVHAGDPPDGAQIARRRRPRA
jgi:glutathione S-transferase